LLISYFKNLDQTEIPFLITISVHCHEVLIVGSVSVITRNTLKHKENEICS